MSKDKKPKKKVKKPKKDEVYDLVEVKRDPWRPTIYTFEYCFSEVIDIFNTLYSNKSKHLTLQDLIKYKPYSVQRWSEWQKKEEFKTEPFYDDFSEAFRKIKDELQNRLVNVGLSGQANSKICALMLSANYGITDKVQESIKAPIKESKEDIELAEITPEMTDKEASDAYKEMMRKLKE